MFWFGPGRIGTISGYGATRIDIPRGVWEKVFDIQAYGVNFDTTQRGCLYFFCYEILRAEAVSSLDEVFGSDREAGSVLKNFF